MLCSLKKIMTKLFTLASFLIILSGCAFFLKSPATTPLTEREIIFNNAKVFMTEEQFVKAEPLFLSLVAEPEVNGDLLYNYSLWNLSLVFEKIGSPEKSILFLNQLLIRQPSTISRFKILASLMKNYFRVGNTLEALRYKKLLDAENPNLRMDPDVVYLDLLQTLNLNFDHLILEELAYVSEIQKYLLFVMEQKESKSSEQAATLLISIYEKAYALTLKDSFTQEFKEKILMALLDNLNQFNNYKLDDLNINLKTVAKVSYFSEKLKKQITDRFYQ